MVNADFQIGNVIPKASFVQLVSTHTAQFPEGSSQSEAVC